MANTKKKKNIKKKSINKKITKATEQLNKSQLIILVVFSVLFLVIVILGIDQFDTSYINKNNLKISDFENKFVLKGYVNRVDEKTNQVIYNDYDMVDVTYNILTAKEETSSNEGYVKLSMEYENMGNTYYGYDNNGNVRNMAYYSFYTLDFFDKYTGEQYWVNLNERQEKTIKYKNKEYTIYYTVMQGVSDLENDWTGVNNVYFTRGVSQKYIVTFEYPKGYDGLIMGASGAVSGYVNDMNVAKKLSEKETVYIMDNYNKSTKLYLVEDIIKALN